MKTLLSSITIAIFILTSFDGNAQKITQFESKRYSFLVGESIHHFRDLGKYFEGNEAEMSLYKESIEQLNQARNAGYVMGVSLAVGIAAILIDPKPEGQCEFICISTGQVILVASLFSTTISAIIRGASMSSYKSKRKKLIDMYNSKFDLSLLEYINKQDYSFSMPNSGLGIVMTF